MDRRAFLGTVALGMLAPVVGEAQQAGRVYRIGWLGLTPPATPAARAPSLEAFVEAARGHGFVEGQNLAIVARYSEGREERNDASAAEFVHMKMDVMVATYAGAARAAKRATQTIPIVMVGGNPERLGLVASLARPGGNLTGISNVATDWGAKVVQFIKDALPERTRVAIFWNPDNPASALTFKETEAPAARALGIVPIGVEVRSDADLDGAFETVLRERAQVLYPHLPIHTHRLRILELARKRSLPVVAPSREWVDLGALLSYGPDHRELYRRAAVYVAKILNGAKPADLPIEQATKFDLVVNLKTAKALGLTIPPSVLARADHVIE